MEELKLRINVIDFFLSGKGHALYQPPTVESCCLQLRKILELIAFASLVANKDIYSAAYTTFATHWHAARLLRDLANVNPDFYPKPVVEMPSRIPGGVNDLKDRDPDYLTKHDFVTVYDECGAIMHAPNPYGTAIDYSRYQQQLPVWRAKIMNLLNSHKIHLINNPGFYLIHMKGDPDDKVHSYKFEPA